MEGAQTAFLPTELLARREHEPKCLWILKFKIVNRVLIIKDILKANGKLEK